MLHDLLEIGEAFTLVFVALIRLAVLLPLALIGLALLYSRLAPRPLCRAWHHGVVLPLDRLLDALEPAEDPEP